MCTHLTRRDVDDRLAAHPQRPRAPAIAATELALLAGADRVEGTLFGNGERTGNLDIVTVALNLYTQGIDPGLDFSDLNAIRDVYERCTQPRGAAAPALRGRARLHRVQRLAPGRDQEVARPAEARASPGTSSTSRSTPPTSAAATAPSSGSTPSPARAASPTSSSSEFGYQLPKLMHKEIGRIVNDLADAKGTELTSGGHPRRLPARVPRAARRPSSLEHFKTSERDSKVKCEARVVDRREGRIKLSGSGQRPDRRLRALARGDGAPEVRRRQLFRALARARAPRRRPSATSRSRWSAAPRYFGAGIDTNIELASIKAIVSAAQQGRSRPRR